MAELLEGGDGARFEELKDLDSDIAGKVLQRRQGAHFSSAGGCGVRHEGAGGVRMMDNGDGTGGTGGWDDGDDGDDGDGGSE